MKDFNQFLQSQLSYKNYNNLQLLLGVSPHRLTKCIARPEQFRIEEIKKLAKLCKTDARWLITYFECGYNSITVAQAIQLGLSISESKKQA